MLLRIIEILFPMFAITALGYGVGRTLQPDLSHANKLNMDVFVPALVFAALANKALDISAYLPLVLAGTLAVVGSGVLAWGVARGTGISAKTLVPPIMFNNCGNLGLPLVVLAFGEQALAPMVVLFMVSNLLHYSFGVWLFDRRVRWFTVWKVPTVVAAFLGLLVSITQFEVWPPLLTSIRMLGEISIPLMLFGLGVRIASSRIESIGFGLFGAVLRPAIGMGLAWLILQLITLPRTEQALLLVFGALPPAVLNFMFAERYHQEPEKVASMVLIGNLASVLFLSLALALVLN